MNQQPFDIVIVGGGMVGAALAVDIAGRPECKPLRVAVVDSDVSQASYHAENFDPRVIAVAEKSRVLLERIGVWSDIVSQRACAYRAMRVWDAEGTGHIHFHADDLHARELGHIVENSCVVRALHKKMATLPTITWFRGCHVNKIQLVGDHYLLGLDSVGGTESAAQAVTQIQAALLVGADGAHSCVRKMGQLPTREWDYGHTAIVTTVKTEAPHQFTCWQRFTSQGPVALLPLQQNAQPQKGEYHVSLVWSAETALAETLMALDETAFCQHLTRATESCLGRVLSVAERFAIPLRQRHAVDYCGPQLVLVGDAAHSIHPLAGQGANLGFYDVEALSEEIARACRRCVPISDGSLLRRYQRARKTQNLSAMIAMEGFKRVYGSDDLAWRWLRNQGMTLVNNQLFLKKSLMKMASGL